MASKQVLLDIINNSGKVYHTTISLARAAYWRRLLPPIINYLLDGRRVGNMKNK
jgi:hypothetical protein